MLKALFIWFDANSYSYWLIGAAPTLLLVAWLAAGLRGHRLAAPGRATDWRVALLLLAVLLAWRWPPLLGAAEMNPDEAQLIAGALTIERDPLPFRSLDNATSGPLNSLALLPTHLLGIPQDYFNARLAGLLMVWGALLAAYAMARSRYSPPVAVLGLLPGIFFFATAADTDFIHYSSEHASLLLGWLGAWLVWRGRPTAGTPGDRVAISWILGGCVLGLLPWAKLQAGPVGAAFALWGAGLACIDTRRPWRTRAGRIATLAAATLLPTLAMLGLLAATGQLEHCYRSYFAYNLGYMGLPLSYAAVIRELWRLSFFTWHFPVFLGGALAIVGLGLAVPLALRRRPGEPLAGAALFLAAATYVVLAPRHGFHHYLLFLVLPLTWCSAVAVGELWGSLSRPWARVALAAFVASIAAGGQLAVRVANEEPPMFGNFAEAWRHPRDKIGNVIHTLARPGDTMAVWGWWSHLYVETGLGQAVRDGHSERQIRPHPLRDTYFRPRYLADLRRNRPAFFVDAVGPGAFEFEERSAYGHESFAALGAYVGEHYRLLDDNGRVRVYLRTDLLAERGAAAPP